MNVGETIKQLRHEKGYTLKDFGEKIGMSVSFLSDIENGKSRPSLKRCKDIAEGFHVPVSLLLGECAKKERNDSKAQFSVSFNCAEGEQIVKELSDFDKWSKADKQELIAYLSAKRMVRNNQ
jgi:transcriptional regulator with XRE-family HTH domain